MNKCSVLSSLILAGALYAPTAVVGQEPVSPKSQAPAAAHEQPTEGEDAPVFDDDGGRVFIMTRSQPRELADLRFHGGEIIAQPRQVSIFLGNGWIDPNARSREARLSGILAALETSSEATELEKRGVTSLALPPLQYEEPWPFDQTGDPGPSISDLQIQRALSTLIENQWTVPPDSNTVYTIFLSPELKSTLGGLFGRKHYLAYHNFFHVESAQVRYVVIPFEPNKKAARSIATQALLRAILNPSGNGWF